MATRATYQIGDVVFYCHWDGYRAGAARRFANMVAALTVPEDPEKEILIEAIQQRRGGPAFAFIRGNADAEPAHRNSHAGHGDTEYCYTVEECPVHGLTIRIGQPTSQADGRRGNGIAFSGRQPLAEFINAHGRDTDAPKVCVMHPPVSYGSKLPPVLATLENAQKLAEVERKIASRFQDGNPNKPIHLQRAAAWERAVEAEQPVALA